MTYARTNTPAISDAEILNWINAGLLVIRSEEGRPIEVWKWHGRRKKYERLKVYSCDDDGRLRCNLRNGTRGGNERQRTIYLNKLVWMYGHRQVVPDGYVLDHANECRTDDRLDNLQLMTYEESDRQGRTLRDRTSAALEEEYGEF
jgi:hypothetical protein